MRIQYCSDLHLEFPENIAFLTRGPLHPVGDVLILAGDIMLLNQLGTGVYDAFVDWVSTHYRMTYWIPGNHEFYGSDLADYAAPLYKKVRENFILLNNRVVEEDGVRLVFSTLWGRISPLNATAIQHSVSDFYVIRDRGERLTPEGFTALHEESMRFLAGVFVGGSDMRTIVVTHHVPTLLHYPPRYLKGQLLEAFASELSPFIERWGADFWIYGHHHINTSPFKIGQTAMLTNQLGYVRHHEHKSFKRNASFLV